MKKTYEINYGNKATINTGNYENLSPMYNIKCIMETERGVDLEKEFAALRNIVDKELKHSVDMVRQELLIKSLKHIRFYEKDGKKYPSVTSIINPDPIEGIPNFELCGLRGTILHRWFEEYLTTGKTECYISDAEKEQLAIIGGVEGFDFSWVMDNRDFEFDKSEVEVYNDTELYAGRYDGDGLFQGKTALFDLKSGDLSKKRIEKAFIQLSAYAKCLPDIKELVVIPCHPKAKKIPPTTTEIDKYYAMFKQKRTEFKERFGI